MPKTITINDIQVKEISISKNEGKWTIVITYGLVDNDGKLINTKRIQIDGSEFTDSQKNNFQKVLDNIKNKLKSLEQI